MKHPPRSAKRKARRARKIRTSVNRSARELIGAAMKKVKATSPVRGSRSTGSANAARDGNRATPKPIFKYPKTELEAAIQRYVDLFDFAPIGYVTFDRVGHIEEINVAAARLLGVSRKRLIGTPFALHVTKEDSALFLNHLLRCRLSESRVETELLLKKRNGEIV